MIIFGHRAKKLSTESITDPCPHCGNRTLEIQVWQRYAHLFWIPAFPMKKIGITQCRHCLQAVDSKNFSTQVTETYNTVKKQYKAPVWMYSFIILFVLLIGIGVYFNNQTKKQTAAFALGPRKGDLFEMKLGPSEYTIARVTDVSADSVVVQLHQYTVNKVTGLRKLKDKGEAGFSDDYNTFARTEITDLVKEGTIHSIQR